MEEKLIALLSDYTWAKTNSAQDEYLFKILLAAGKEGRRTEMAAATPSSRGRMECSCKQNKVYREIDREIEEI